MAELFRPLPTKRIVEVLKLLQEEHTKAGQGLKGELLLAFNAYITAFRHSDEASNHLSSLFLLNREGSWKPAAELCADAEGIADSHLIDDAQNRLLLGLIIHADRRQAIESEMAPRSQNLQPEISASADILESFFAEWEGLVTPELICAFISLLGGDSKMLDLAERYRGSHSVEWVKDNIPWEVHHRNDDHGRREWMYGLDMHQAMTQHRFIISCSDGLMVQTYSILGTEIEVPLKSHFSSLITGGLFYEYPEGQVYRVRLKLRRPAIEEATPSELSGFLRSSAEYLLNKAYNQRNYNLGRLWEDLDRSEQLDIRIAQQLVLNHIPFYMRQLGVHKHPRLQDLLNAWNEVRYKIEEYYESTERRAGYEKEARDLLRRIQDLLKSDPEVQNVILNAVRMKMRDFQYTVSSIPFELFQNADDAVVELAAIKAYPETVEDAGAESLPSSVKRFMVLRGEKTLSFVHWGRAVNATGSGGFPPTG